MFKTIQSVSNSLFTVSISEDNPNQIYKYVPNMFNFDTIITKYEFSCDSKARIIEKKIMNKI